MKVLLTGGRGMLGRTLAAVFARDGLEVVASDLPEADITQAGAFDRFVGGHRPDVLIHCAAMTAVDRCEREPELAFRLNAQGSANVAAVCRRLGIRLIAISTDYVFDGASDRPYAEFDRATGGATVYGKSKFAGEECVRRHCPDHLIVRTAWLYGPGGPSFVHTILRLAAEGRPLTVVDDQRGNPTSAFAVAEMLLRILRRPRLTGTFHVTCEGETSWHGFAQAILAQMGLRQTVRPCATRDFPRPAPRPANSALDNRMLRLAGLPPMPRWQDALADFLRQEWPRGYPRA